MNRNLETLGEKRLRSGLFTQDFPGFYCLRGEKSEENTENFKSTFLNEPDNPSQSSSKPQSLFDYTENFSSQSFLASNDFLALKGGAKKKSSSKVSTRSSSKPSKKQKTSESKSSKLAATFSPKMKKKSSSFSENSVDLTIYTSPSKTLNPSSSSPRKSPRSPASRKVIFNLDQNMVLEFNKKKIISKAKITPKKKSSKSILKVRTSPRRKESGSLSN